MNPAEMTRQQRLAETLLCTVERRGTNSNAPWEIIHQPTGMRVTGPVHSFHHPHLGWIPLQLSFFASREEAERMLDLGIKQLSTDDLEELARLVGPCCKVA